MKTLALLTGLVGVIAGVALGFYVGFYLMLAGGIKGLISAVPIIAAGGNADALVAFSLLKISCFAFGGYISALAVVHPSNALINYAFMRD